MADAQEGDLLAKVNALADLVSEKGGCDVLLSSGYLNRLTKIPLSHDARLDPCGTG
jgi:hypothetical protein